MDTDNLGIDFEPQPIILEFFTEFNIEDKMNYLKFMLEHGSAQMPKVSEGKFEDDGCGVYVTFEGNKVTIINDMLDPNDPGLLYEEEVSNAWEQAMNNAHELLDAGPRGNGVRSAYTRAIFGYATSVPKVKTGCDRKAVHKSKYPIKAAAYMTMPQEALKKLAERNIGLSCRGTFSDESGQYTLDFKGSDGMHSLFFIDVQMHILAYYDIPALSALNNEIVRAFR